MSKDRRKLKIKIRKKLERRTFYDTIRTTLFYGKITSLQFEGIETIFNEWRKRELKDKRWLAYILATVKHESNNTMQPIEEIGKGKGYEYGLPAKNGKIFYGRGFVQITWSYNYIKMGDLLNIPLYEHPELALDCSIATQILFEGMIRGIFTGRRLSDYINSKKCDYFGARKIINGQDKAIMIAGIANKFEYALT